MATTKKEGVPAKERPSRSSLTPSTMQNPRARATRPSSPATSEKDAAATAAPTSARKPTPNYLKPTFSSFPDAAKVAKAPAAGTARAPQRSLPSRKGLDAKPQPQRSSSFNPPRAQKAALSSRSSFSERTIPSKGKPSSLSRTKVDSPTGRKPGCGGGGGSRSKCSSTTSSANASASSSPKAMSTEDTMSNEDKEAALDILNLEAEEHVLLEIPPVVDKTALPDEPAHEEEHEVAEEPAASVEEENAVNPVEADVEESSHEPVHDGEVDGSEEGKTQDGDTVEETKSAHEEEPAVEVEKNEYAEKPSSEDEEKAVLEGPGDPDGEGVVAKVECDDGGEKLEEAGVDGGGERVKLRVSGVEEDAAPAPSKEKRKEAATQPGKKEAAPAYNDVIEETASRLVGKRKSKVKALVGAFETVIVIDSGGQAH